MSTLNEAEPFSTKSARRRDHRRGNVIARLRQMSLVEWFLAATCFAVVYRETFGTDTLVFIGSYNLTLTEPSLALAILALGREIRHNQTKFDMMSLLALILFSIQLIDLIRGIYFGPVAAITNLRQFGVTFTAFVLVLCFADNSKFRDSAEKYLLWAAYAITVLAIARMLISPSLFLVRAAELEGRPILAQGAFVIAVGIVIALRRTMSQGDRHALLPLLTMIVVICTVRQGTALASASAGAAIMLMFNSGRAANVRILAGLLVLSVACVLYAFSPEIFSLEYWISVLPAEFGQTLGNRSATLNGRHMVWDAVLVAYQGSDLLTQMLGIPFGTQLRVIMLNPDWGATPWVNSYHSMYFQALVSFGAVGATIFVLLMGFGGLRAIFAPASRKLGDGGKWVSLAVIVMSALMSYSYDLRAESGVILAFGFAALQPPHNRTRGNAKPAGPPAP